MAAPLSVHVVRKLPVERFGAPGGAALVEAVIGVSRGIDLPPGLYAYPPHPDPRASGPPPVTLAERDGQAPDLDSLVRRLTDAHARVYHCAPAPHELDFDLAAAPAPAPPPREDERDLVRSGPAPVPIGFVEALV